MNQDRAESNAVSPDSADFEYDEFSMFGDNAAEVGIEPLSDLQVDRRSILVQDGRSLSSLHFGASPSIVFLHGTGQNAHTWDTVALALGLEGIDIVSVDLAGHGHSTWRDDRSYDLADLGDDVVHLLSTLTVDQPVMLVGMSLGGMVATYVVATRPELVRRLAVVDITPGTTRSKAKNIMDFIKGPPSFPSFDEILARTVEFNPDRSESSMRRGILHNAQRGSDGAWSWRYDRRGRDGEAPPRGDLWLDVEAVGAAGVPHLLIKGTGKGSVVDDADVEEFKKRNPAASVVMVEGAGHSVQGDKPLELAEILLAELRQA